jgi:two-component system, OmpR family, KDP operon response regulator KdpE
LTRVLVVDDEPSILRALRINLTARNYQVSTASDGASGLAVMARDRPDVMILDLGLPDMDGTEVIRGVRGWASTPIIVLSVWGHESQKVAALDAGADDYVTKPFGMDELLAPLRAAIRRSSPAPDEPVVKTGDFTVDLTAKRVTRADGRRRPADPHRVAAAGDPGAQPRPACHAASAPPGGRRCRARTDVLCARAHICLLLQ